MTEWKKFQIKENDFRSKSEYNKYRKNTSCAICHKRLEIGEEFDLRGVTTLEENEKYNGSKYNAIAVVVHKKCIEK